MTETDPDLEAKARYQIDQKLMRENLLRFYRDLKKLLRQEPYNTDNMNNDEIWAQIVKMQLECDNTVGG
jgi:hypothetical protein